MSMQVSEIISDIKRGRIGLPEFQREFKWTTDKVSRFLKSLYEGYPVGSLIFWKTSTNSTRLRGQESQEIRDIDLLVDGQQRMSTLYGVIEGEPPKFFKGDAKRIQNIHFHLDKEMFASIRNKVKESDSLWINVTDIMQRGTEDTSTSILSNLLNELTQDEAVKLHGKYVDRLKKLHGIKKGIFNIETVSEVQSLDKVVEIFKEVNTGGTPPTRGDLAIAKICVRWSIARDDMENALDQWRERGFNLKIDWLLRCMNANLTGKTSFTDLVSGDIDELKLRQGLKETTKYIDLLLDNIQDHLGIDHDYILKSLNSFPIMVHYLTKWRGFRNGVPEIARLLCWYLHTIIWRHYTGASDNRFQVDLDIISQGDTWGASLNGLMQNLRQMRGSLEVHHWHFDVSQVNSTYYPFMYVLARTGGARDFGTNIKLSRNLNQQMHLHHLFPKSLLKKYSRNVVNALGNYSFLTRDSNLKISNREPEDYFEEVSEKCPGALESQWIPNDRNLWKLDNYLDFLVKRRTCLAKAANKLLSNLEAGILPSED